MAKQRRVHIVFLFGVDESFDGDVGDNLLLFLAYFWLRGALGFYCDRVCKHFHYSLYELTSPFWKQNIKFHNGPFDEKQVDTNDVMQIHKWAQFISQSR